MDPASLEEVYSAGLWPEEPGDPRAVKRFNEYIDVLRALLERVERLTGTSLPGKPRVLDVAAGTGIGGAALVCSLARLGYTPELYLLDLRSSKLHLVERWMRMCGCSVPWHAVAADALSSWRLFRTRFDIVSLLGSSMPHFPPLQATQLLSSLSAITSNKGLVILEQRDIAAWIILQDKYHEFKVEEVDPEKGEALVSMHAGYDPVKGVVKRLYYKLPQWRYVAMLELHLWHASSLTALATIFYNRVYVAIPKPYTHIIIAVEPRRTAPSPSELESINLTVLELSRASSLERRT